MSDKAFLMEAINEYLEAFVAKRLSVIEQQAPKMSNEQLRDEVAQYRAAKAIKADLSNKFKY